MPNIAPSSTITLYRDVDIIPGQQIAFRSVSEQRTYFARKKAYELVNCSYVRKSGSLRVELPTSSVMKCDYLSFTNPSFENIVFYAVIDRCEYINNVTTEIFYSLDYFQTFCFTVNYKKSYIERQHLSVDGWNKVEANPYTNQVYEMQTSEQLASDPSMMAPYVDGENMVISSSDRSGMWSYVIVSVLGDFNDQDTNIDRLTKHCDGWIDEAGNCRTNTIVPGIADGNKLTYRIPKCAWLFIFNFDYNNGAEALDKFKKYINEVTSLGLTSNILSNYVFPSGDFGVWTNLMRFGDIMPPFTRVEPKTDYYNKKLCRYPYSYITVTTTVGGVKEYHFEEFFSLIEGGDYAQLNRIFTFDANPAISLVPSQYRQKVNSVNEGMPNYNIDERIDGGMYPQLPYTIDAYLTFLSSTYQSYMSGMTDQKKEGLNRSTDFFGRMVDGIAGGLSMVPKMMGFMSTPDVPAGAAGAGMSGAATVNNPAAMAGSVAGSVSLTGVNDMLVSGQERVAKKEWADGWLEGEDPVGPFGPSKSAFVNDAYVAPQSDNSLSYYITGGYGPGTFYIKSNNLLKSIADKYDMYFSMYGYTYNAPGVPRVCNYIQGSNNDADLPHWDTQYMSVPSTYVKTHTMIVDGNTMGAVEYYISQMFNAGVRFLKGSELI